jgi:hypothetical protein
MKKCGLSFVLLINLLVIGFLIKTHFFGQGLDDFLGLLFWGLIAGLVVYDIYALCVLMWFGDNPNGQKSTYGWFGLWLVAPIVLAILFFS